MSLLKLATVGAIGYLLYTYANKTIAQAAHNDPGLPEVRDAGTENMTSPPATWSKTDDSIDASFPASDPPSTY